MAQNLLHEPAMLRIQTSKITPAFLAQALRTLAATADESNANDAAATITYHEHNEQVLARYTPEITLRVRQVTPHDT